MVVWRWMTDGRYVGCLASDVEADKLHELTTADALRLADDKLVGRRAMVIESVDVKEDDEAVQTLRPRKVGYVRGRIRPAADRKASDYKLQEADSPDAAEYRSWYDDVSGEFLIGPLPEGTHLIAAVDKTREGLQEPHLTTAAEIRSTQVVRVEIDAANPRRPKRFSGRVLQADGRTPAHGAAVSVVRPRYDGPTMSTTAKADGTFSAVGSIYWGSEYEVPDRWPPSEGGPALVAWLPGHTAPAIVPLGDHADTSDLRIVLPPARSVRGRVTVAGRPIDDGSRESRAGTFHVAAVSESKDPRVQLVKPTTTPQADGTFELGGLAEGTYRVQASLDGIWLSNVVEVIVDREGSLKPIMLNIGLPGLPMSLKCVDGNGAPRADLELRVLAPEGPLSRTVRGQSFATDARGFVLVPPLEAGRHQLEVVGTGKRFALEVPPVVGSPAAIPEREVRVE
jgi:hypothetical protein